MWKLVVTCALSALSVANAAEYKVEQREATHHVFGKDTALDVDNVNGFVSVIGDNEPTIRVDTERIIRGEDQAQVDLAKREVTLDMNEKNGVAQLYVNGPFRGSSSHDGDNHGFHEHEDRHYRVTYNFTIHVPKTAAVSLRTVNGAVNGENTSGRFDVHAVNGAVELKNMAGPGNVNAVNGAIDVAFRENPKTDSSFKSVNGRIHVTLQPALSADLTFKTVNGHLDTSFDLIAQSNTGTAERKDGKFIYNANRFQRFKAGNGGPTLAFETVNGDIQIEKTAR